MDRAERDAWLAERRAWEARVLAEWCERAEGVRVAEEKRGKLVAGRELAVSRLLEGMTPAQRRAVERARARGGGRRQSAAMVRRRVLLAYRSDKVREVEARWDERIRVADGKVHEAQAALAETAVELRTDRALGLRDVLGLSRAKLAWIIRRPGLTVGAHSQDG